MNFHVRTTYRIQWLPFLYQRQQVKKKLDKINVTKTSGPDEIHLSILYELKDRLIYPLVKIFNFSIANKQLPRDWLSKLQEGKEGPISLTCIVCKQMESIP